jgi:CO dehydrogenase maturation factor
MGFTIAVAGKGGTGKTSLCGLTIRYLTEKKHGAILAVDADANANLHEVLGVKVHATVGKLRETSLEAIKSTAPRPGGMSMEQLFDYQIQQALIEAKGFDLLVMGRPEGSGCYCAANNIIRKYMDKLADTYPYTVMDNEAGLEHLSRRTTQDTDLLIIISDSSVRGIMTAGRINELVKELSLNVKRSVLIVNRAPERETSGDKSLQQAIEHQGVEFAGFVPADELIFEYDLNGRPLIQLPPDSKALNSFYGILDKLIP